MPLKYVVWSIGISVMVLGFLFLNFYHGLRETINQEIVDIQKIDLASTVVKIGEQIFAPQPLAVGGFTNSVVLDSTRITKETNSQRHENNLLPLVENAKLSESARAKAEDMFRKQYFEHTSPDGIDSGTLIKNYGYEYIVSGENLILGNFSNEKDVVQKWMNSPGHRANILNERFTEIGVAVVKGIYKGDTVWISVQEFGLPLSACPMPSEQLKEHIEIQQADLQIRANALIIEKQDASSDVEYNAMVKEYNAQVQENRKWVTEYNNQITLFNSCVRGN